MPVSSVSVLPGCNVRGGRHPKNRHAERGGVSERGEAAGNSSTADVRIGRRGKCPLASMVAHAMDRKNGGHTGLRQHSACVVHPQHCSTQKSIGARKWLQWRPWCQNKTCDLDVHTMQAAPCKVGGPVPRCPFPAGWGVEVADPGRVGSRSGGDRAVTAAG